MTEYNSIPRLMNILDFFTLPERKRTGGIRSSQSANYDTGKYPLISVLPAIFPRRVDFSDVYSEYEQLGEEILKEYIEYLKTYRPETDSKEKPEHENSGIHDSIIDF